MKPLASTVALLILITLTAIAQSKSNYASGFEKGFKEGYCYNSENVYCFTPMTPMAPMPRLNESEDNHTQGYNRGFQFGLDLKRSNDALNNSNTNMNVQLTKFNDYIQQNPIDAMTAVGMMMQKKYDTRKAWIQERIDQLAELKNTLFSKETLPSSYDVNSTRSVYWKTTVDYVNKIKAMDYADDNQFNSIRTNFSKIESYYYKSYNEIIKEAQAEAIEETTSRAAERQSESSQDETTYLDKAVENLKQNNNNAALENLNTAIEINPNNPASYNLRARVYLYGFRNYDKAVEDFTTVIQMQPEYGYAYLYRGMAYNSLDKKIEAIKDFSKTIDLEPENTDARFMRAFLKSSMDDYLGAISDYNEILKREKTTEPVLYTMGTVYNNKAYSLIKLNRLDEALPLVNKALEMEPNKSYIWGSRGELFYKKGDFNKCIKDMTKAIELSIETKNSSDPSLPYYLRGLSRIKIGQKAEGCNDLSKAGELGKSEAYKAISENCK